ncbi:unnamed protein product [Rhizoctonia solani]|uniref:Uncharacterized protein n=1 Tax=Rhizoctonia solani TaxID=456999 RepID=A0A8H3B9C1_9AGAM|nr:unnamed protein product [Rhizoctonia solani]
MVGSTNFLGGTVYMEPIVAQGIVSIKVGRKATFPKAKWIPQASTVLMTCAKPSEGEDENGSTEDAPTFVETSNITPPGSNPSHNRLFRDDSAGEIHEQETETMQAIIQASRHTQLTMRVGGGSGSALTTGQLPTSLQSSSMRQQNRTPRPHSPASAQPLPRVIPQAPAAPPAQVTTRIPNAYVADTAAVRAFFSELEDQFPDANGRDDKLMFTLRNGTVEQAARIFYNYLLDFTARECGLDTPVIDVDNHWADIIHNVPQTITGLISRHRHSWK